MREVDRIIDKLKEIKPELEKNFFVREIGVFGSYVRDDYSENSDVDILIDYNRGLTLFKLARLKTFLSNVLNKEVDIALKKTLKPGIGEIILSEVIYV